MNAIFPPLACGSPPQTVEKLVIEASVLLQPAIAQRNLRVTMDTPGATPVGDREQVREQIVNLLANAIACAPQSAELAVIFDASRECLEVRIGNKSMALTTERDILDVRGHVFHLSSRAGVGTALRLAIRSTRPGAGATAAVTK